MLMFSIGLGTPVFAERFETKMVAREEGDEIAKTGTAAVADWDAGWDDDTIEDTQETEDHAPFGKSRASMEEERRASETRTPQLSIMDSSPAISPTQTTNDDDDDAAQAWGWEDDDATEESAAGPEPQAASSQVDRSPVLREMTLTESYWTSSIPKPLFNSILTIYEDSATLMKPESVLIF
jgi:centromere/kinetochore protein ZW10